MLRSGFQQLEISFCDGLYVRRKIIEAFPKTVRRPMHLEHTEFAGIFLIKRFFD